MDLRENKDGSVDKKSHNNATIIEIREALY